MILLHIWKRNSMTIFTIECILYAIHNIFKRRKGSLYKLGKNELNDVIYISKNDVIMIKAKIYVNDYKRKNNEKEKKSVKEYDYRKKAKKSTICTKKLP